MSNAPLNDTTRALIVKRWKDGERNKSQLARQYNTSSRTIGRIVDKLTKDSKPKKVAAKVKDALKIGDIVVRIDSTSPKTHEVLNLSNSPVLNVELTEMGWSDGSKYEAIGHAYHGKSSPEPVVVDKPEPTNPIATITTMCVMLSIDGSPRVIDMTHPLFEEITEDVKAGRYNAAYEKMDIKTAIENYSEGFLKIVNGQVHYNGQKIDNKLGEKIVHMMQEGNEGFKSFALFFLKAMENPSKESREQLMGFVAADDITISEDGEVLAYKNVGKDYRPSRVGMYDDEGVYHANEYYTNRIGDVCQMPRGLVEDNKNITCAHGLHICSVHYLQSCWGTQGHTMQVKVHPRDVVSIPTDYNNSKGRVCRYEVVADVTDKLQEIMAKLK